MIQALGWTLVHFLWQGAVLALLFAVINRLLRRSTANARYLAGCVTLALMLAAPIATFVRLEHPAAARVSFGVAPAIHAVVAAVSSSEPSREISWLSLVVAMWVAGVAILSVRMAGGLLIARRLRLRATPVTDREWLNRLRRLAARLELRRGVVLCESVLAEVPMAIGWLRPVVLVPAGALLRLSPQEMEAILAHELAHIRRHDYLVNLAQATVETLLFYHPAVWWMGRRIRAERENCCDDLAVAACGDALVYARALVELETLAGRAPRMALAATGGPLLARVKRLLRADQCNRRNPATGLAAILLVAALVATWSCAQPVLHGTSAASRTDSVVPAPALTRAAQRERNDTAKQAAGTAGQVHAAPQRSASTSAENSGGSYIDAMAAAGYPNLSADDLIALKMQGVTPQYARRMRAAGFAPPARELAAMRTMNVTANYARQMKDAFPEITARELIACRTQGVDPQTAIQLDGIGFGKLNVHEVIAARVQGVDADYVRALKSAGFADLTLNQTIAARLQGVTPEYVHQLKSAGFSNLRMNAVIAARTQGVTPDYVRSLKAAGFGDLTLNRVVAARIQDVTPEYVSGLKGTGFPNLTFNEALRAKVMGLTPEFVRQARQHGFRNLTIEKLIQLKSMDVL